MTRFAWHLRSFRDHDTHLAPMPGDDGEVSALCGVRFPPLTTLTQSTLPDTAQGCTACAAEASRARTDTARPRAAPPLPADEST